MFSTQCRAVQTAKCCRKSTQLLYNRAINIKKTENKNENRFHQRKAAEGDGTLRDQPGTVRLVSSNSRPVLLIGGRLVGWFLRLVLLAPVVVSCSTQSCPQKENPASLCFVDAAPGRRIQVGNTSLQGHRVEHSGTSPPVCRIVNVPNSHSQKSCHYCSSRSSQRISNLSTRKLTINSEHCHSNHTQNATLQTWLPINY